MKQYIFDQFVKNIVNDTGYTKQEIFSTTKKSEISLAGSSFEITSGISKIGLAVLVDKYSPSKILAISLILSAFINLLLCATENIYIISFLCGTNGALQSLGWPSLSNIFMNFFPDPSERGRWYSFLSTNQNVGSFAPAIILPFVETT